MGTNLGLFKFAVAAPSVTWTCANGPTSTSLMVSNTTSDPDPSSPNVIMTFSSTEVVDFSTGLTHKPSIQEYKKSYTSGIYTMWIFWYDYDPGNYLIDCADGRDKLLNDFNLAYGNVDMAF